MKVLITGGAGFIGSHSAECLLARGHAVRVLDNLSTGRRDNLPQSPHLELIQGDVRDAADVNAACAGADACLHLAAQVSVTRSIEDPLQSAEHNIFGHLRVLHSAVAAGVKRVVYASSAAVYGDPEQLPLSEAAHLAPLSPYGLEKRVNEQYAALFGELHGLSALGLRYFNVYGPRQDPASPYAGVISRFVDRLLEGRRPVVFGDGGQTRDFIYVEDVARANAHAIENTVDGICNVATGRQVSLLELLDTLGRVTGQAAEPAFEAAREGDIRHSLGNPARLAELLGVHAECTLEQGLSRLVAWYSGAAARVVSGDYGRPLLKTSR